MYIDPWSNKEALRRFLRKLGEWKQLDDYIQYYIRGILSQKIICRPSKGPYGEQGKDIAACEDEDNLSYCSYIIKCGDLSKNLDGNYGILKQLSDALLIELENRDYEGKLRTVVVVHNGEEGYRGSLAKYESHRQSLEDILMTQGRLLRPVERWDLDALTDRFFPHGERFKEMERSRQAIDYQLEIVDLAIGFRNESAAYLAETDQQPQTSDSLIRDYVKRFDSLKANYSPALRRQFKRGQDGR